MTKLQELREEYRELATAARRLIQLLDHPELYTAAEIGAAVDELKDTMWTEEELDA